MSHQGFQILLTYFCIHRDWLIKNLTNAVVIQYCICKSINSIEKLCKLKNLEEIQNQTAIGKIEISKKDCKIDVQIEKGNKSQDRKGK